MVPRSNVQCDNCEFGEAHSTEAMVPLVNTMGSLESHLEEATKVCVADAVFVADGELNFNV